jgi:hypothetical protein
MKMDNRTWRTTVKEEIQKLPIKKTRHMQESLCTTELGKADLSGARALRLEKAFGMKMDPLMRT